MFKASDEIGKIASKFPGAMEIFQDYKIDFCCGGDRPLSKAIEEKGLDEEDVLSRINNAYKNKKEEIEESKEKDWEKASMTELIDYIINKHHAFLRDKLPEISDLVIKILRVHGDSHGDELEKVHRLFHNLKMDLEHHLIKEEEKLFPIIKEFENDRTSDKLKDTFEVIADLEDEHDTAGDILKELREVTRDFEIPDDGCKTYEYTYKLLEDLEKDLFRHIHLENNILFKRLEMEREGTIT